MGNVTDVQIMFIQLNETNTFLCYTKATRDLLLDAVQVQTPGFLTFAQIFFSISLN